MAPFNTITPAQLMRRIGLPDTPQIIDVRIAEDLATHPHIIPTSFLHSHNDFRTLLDRLNQNRCVVVCHKGLKLSHGIAALLRDAGRQAEVLEGGHVAWADAGLPMIPLDQLPPRRTEPTRWVTRHRPKIDRIACPWLIRRFIDPQATFLFVPPPTVLDVADKFNATPFDVEDVTLTHRRDRCTFDAIISDYGLLHNALERVADVVRAADTNHPEQSPQAAGLLALSVGLSRMYRDDTAQLDAAMPLYDALYRWARDGFDETHDWPA